MIKAVCPDCKESREVKWKPKKGVVCLSCRKKGRQINPVGERTKYTRVCKCGDIATVGYKPKGTEMCRLCRGKIQAKDMCGKNVKRDEDKKRYTHICAMCTSVRVTVDGRKSNLCRDCSRKHARKKKSYIYFDFKEMKMKAPKRYFAYCDVCDGVREVCQSQFSQYGYNNNCRKHAKRKKVNKKSDMQIIKEARKKPKSKSKEISQASIKRVQEINRDHRKAVENITEKKPKIIKQKKTDEDMMTEFLKKNKPTIIKSSYVEKPGQTDCSRPGY